MLTAHDRRTAPNLNAVVFAHAMPECALAAATKPRKAHLQVPLQPRLSRNRPPCSPIRSPRRVNNQQRHYPAD